METHQRPGSRFAAVEETVYRMFLHKVFDFAQWAEKTP